MKLETDIKISYILFYGGVISLAAWILTLIIIMVFFAPITDTYVGVAFLFWGMISTSAVITQAGNHGCDPVIRRF